MQNHILHEACRITTAWNAVLELNFPIGLMVIVCKSIAYRKDIHWICLFRDVANIFFSEK